MIKKDKSLSRYDEFSDYKKNTNFLFPFIWWYQMIIHVLGTAQDGGYPHTGCKKDCCKKETKKCCVKYL